MELKRTERSNYRSYRIKDCKGNKTNNLRSRGQTKDVNKRKYLRGLYNRTSGIKKKLI